MRLHDHFLSFLNDIFYFNLLYHFLSGIFLFLNSVKSIQTLNKSSRFHLKIESDEVTATTIVFSLLVKNK